MIGLVGSFYRNVDVFGLVFTELGELGTDAAEVKASNHLIEVLRKHVHLFGVLATLGE